MLWLILTQNNGEKIRVNISRADTYYNLAGDEEALKEMPNAKSVIEVEETAYYVQETAEEIDIAVADSASPLRVFNFVNDKPEPVKTVRQRKKEAAKQEAKDIGWGGYGNKT